MSLHPALLLPPIGLLCYDRVCERAVSKQAKQIATETNEKSSTKNMSADQRLLPNATAFAAQVLLSFLASAGLLLLLSRILLPSWQFIPSVYLTLLQLPDLTPNPGLWWYFFVEMFDPFRSFFLGVFWLHMLSYSVPFCLRFSKQPLAAVVLMMGVIAIFQPYANVGDTGMWLSCLCLFGHVFECELFHDNGEDAD